MLLKHGFWPHKHIYMLKIAKLSAIFSTLVVFDFFNIIFSCPIEDCDFSSSTRDRLEYHKRSHGKIKLNSAKNDKPKTLPINIIQCDTCEKKFSSDTNLQQHIYAQHAIDEKRYRYCFIYTVISLGPHFETISSSVPLPYRTQKLKKRVFD